MEKEKEEKKNNEAGEEKSSLPNQSEEQVKDREKNKAVIKRDRRNGALVRREASPTAQAIYRLWRTTHNFDVEVPIEDLNIADLKPKTRRKNRVRKPKEVEPLERFPTQRDLDKVELKGIIPD